MSNVTDDKLLDEYLRGGSQYSKLYGADDSDVVPNELVPGELDRAVVAEARAAVTRRKGGALLRWTPMLAVAATSVLTISLVVRTGFMTPKKLSEEEISVSAATQPTTKLEESQRYTVQADKEKSSTESLPKLSNVDALQETRVAAEPQLRAKSADIASKIKADEPPAEKDSFADRLVQTTPPALLAPRIAEQARSEGARGSVGSVNSPSPAAAPATKPNNPAAVSEVVVTGSYVQRTPEDVALPVNVISSEDIQQQGSSALNLLRSKRGPASGSGPRGTVPVEAQSLSEKKAERQSRESDADEWLNYIRELRADGRTTEADREWGRFVKAYPKHEVAADDRARPRRNIR